CLGCIIKGETPHDIYLSEAVSQGIMQLNIDKGVPVIFGVLTTNNMDQAMDRAGGEHGNKGAEAALAALHMAYFNEKI
nr:6,7-dimethyl-8-ribityllumazine synthase [Saprospiraceae bacterium]